MPHHNRMLNALSRIMFALWMLDEVSSYSKRNDPECGTMSPQSWVLLLLPVPTIWPLRLPRTVRVAGLILQLIALIIMLGARRQLIAARSFGWSAEAATQPQQRGFYRYLEHPIYGAGLLHIVGLSASNPLILLIPTLSMRNNAAAISNERRFLSQLGVTHRGADSAYWDFVIATTGHTA